MTHEQWAKLLAVINGKVAEQATGRVHHRQFLASGVGGPSPYYGRDSVADKSRIILSRGGGIPPDVSTENIEAFLSAVG